MNCLYRLHRVLDMSVLDPGFGANGCFTYIFFLLSLLLEHKGVWQRNKTGKHNLFMFNLSPESLNGSTTIVLLRGNEKVCVSSVKITRGEHVFIVPSMKMSGHMFNIQFQEIFAKKITKNTQAPKWRSPKNRFIFQQVKYFAFANRWIRMATGFKT